MGMEEVFSGRGLDGPETSGSFLRELTPKPFRHCEERGDAAIQGLPAPQGRLATTDDPTVEAKRGSIVPDCKGSLPRRGTQDRSLPVL